MGLLIYCQCTTTKCVREKIDLAVSLQESDF